MTLAERFSIWLAWMLPRGVVSWAAIRVLAHATTGKYGNTVPGDLGAMEAIDRWDHPTTPNQEG